MMFCLELSELPVITLSSHLLHIPLHISDNHSSCLPLLQLRVCQMLTAFTTAASSHRQAASSHNLAMIYNEILNTSLNGFGQISLSAKNREKQRKFIIDHCCFMIQKLQDVDAEILAVIWPVAWNQLAIAYPRDDIAIEWLCRGPVQDLLCLCLLWDTAGGLVCIALFEVETERFMAEPGMANTRSHSKLPSTVNVNCHSLFGPHLVVIIQACKDAMCAGAMH